MITAGRGLGADRILDELTRPKINIWRLINSTIAQGIRKTRRTWRRLNRKLPMIRPGREYYGCDAMILLDSSGSIGEKTYKKFAGIINSLIRRGGRFRVISFSDGYIDHGINPQMMKIKTESGGTYPQCLTELISKEKPQTIVMLTDGEWFGDYKSFLNVIKRVPESILITTYTTHRGFKRVFKIEGD
jgi:predicted metal-dependent peptidase